MPGGSLSSSWRPAAACLALAAASPGGAAAQIGVQVNGAPVRFGAVGPMQMGGRVMIPLRSVGEALGAQLEWQAATRTVRGARDDRTFELSVSSRIASVGGRAMTLDVPAAMERGTVLVPLRFVAEALGAEVEWRPATQQVIVSTAGAAPGAPGPAAPGTVSGEVVAVDPFANPPTVTVRAGGIRQTFPLDRGALVLRGPAGAPGVQTDLASVRPGDVAQLRVDEARGTVTVVEAQSGGAAQPVPARPEVATAPLQVQSLTHNAGGWLRAGSEVEITLEGTPAATATVDAGSLARGVPLREDPARPGRYVGRFVVPSGVTAKDVPVIARLERGGQRARLVQAGTALSIDSQPPQITGEAPAPGTRTPNQRPNVYVNFNDQGGSGIDSSSFRMQVRGRDVTPNATVTPSFAIYTPEPLPEGPVSVQVEIRDAAGNPASASWSFTVAPTQSLIRSVTQNAQGPLAAGDVLTVRMTGQPGGRASFDVGSAAKDVPMTEESPGNYVGTYTVRRGDQDLKAAVVGHLRIGGQQVSQEATAPVPIVTEALSAPRITAPAANAAVADGFVVTGQAPPGSKVAVEVTYTGRALGLLPVQGTAGSQEVTADDRGEFRTKPFALQLPLGISRTQFQIQAATVDPAGRRSDVTTVPVKAR